MRTSRGALAAIAAMAVLGWVLVACGSDSKESTAAVAPPADVAEGGTGDQVPADQTGDLPADRSIIITGEVSVRVTDIRAAVDAVRTRIVALGGYLANSDVALDSTQPTADLTFRVPAAKYDDASAAAGEIGTLLSQRANTEDVTAQVVDLDARIAALAVSIERLKTFLAASKDVDELTHLESELTDRETSLEQLRAQQRSLADQISLATLQVHLTTSGVPASANAGEDPGFGTGLSHGVDAVHGILVATITVLGFLLPLTPVIVIIVVVVVLWRRRTRRRVATTPPSPAAPLWRTPPPAPIAPPVAPPAPTPAAGAAPSSGDGDGDGGGDGDGDEPLA